MSVHADLDMIQNARIVDIPNGVHVERFSGSRSFYLYEYLNIPRNKKIILSVGRNHIKKGYDYGIKAVAKLKEKYDYHDIHYVIVGRGVDIHRKIVDACNAGDVVTLIDEMTPEEITQCYKSATVFFSPSIVEGLSLVSIEAMASGLPLVVTDVPGNDDVVKANGCGLIVKNSDEESMADGLYRILSDESYRNDLADLSQRCSYKYDWSKIALMYVDVYKNAIEKWQTE